MDPTLSGILRNDNAPSFGPAPAGRALQSGVILARGIIRVFYTDRGLCPKPHIRDALVNPTRETATLHGEPRPSKRSPRATLLRPVDRAVSQAHSIAQLPGEAGEPGYTSKSRPGQQSRDPPTLQGSLVLKNLGRSILSTRRFYSVAAAKLAPLGTRVAGGQNLTLRAF